MPPMHVKMPLTRCHRMMHRISGTMHVGNACHRHDHHQDDQDGSSKTSHENPRNQTPARAKTVRNPLQRDKCFAQWAEKEVRYQ
jgi:hypothetical protein